MSASAPPAAFDVAAVRAQFPVLSRSVHGKPLVYLDNAATNQKPRAVLEAIEKYYTETNSNVHRGVHALSAEATDAYEATRGIVRRFLNAPKDEEIIFTSGTTAGINLVAQSFGRRFIGQGDRVLISAMEHHSGIVPWQMLCEAVGAHLDVIPMNADGVLEIDKVDALLTDRTKMLSIVHTSNALGTINPVRTLIEKAHAVGAKVLIDGAQAVAHGPVDVQALDADFFAFSAHKVFGPTGSGVLWGKAELLDAMPPFLGGGDMIRSVSFEKTTWNSLPYKFEAGTPNICGVIAMGAGLKWFEGLGIEAAVAHEQHLLDTATERLKAIQGVRIIGTAPAKSSVLSFVMEGAHPNDIGTILDRDGIAVRTGHHCAEPVMKFFGIPGTARASFAPYNTIEEVHAFADGLERVQRLFA